MIIWNQFKAKPIAVEAYQADFDFYIESTNATYHVQKGDWVISYNGELYTLPSGIFEEVFEEGSHEEE